VTVRSGKCAQGLKKPFGVSQECGNRNTQNPKFVGTVHQVEHVAVGRRFDTQETEREEPCFYKS
jgi:hypothetical protein